MCMISGAVTKNYGLLAADSAQYDSRSGKMTFTAWKLFFTQKCLLTFLGTPVYFANIDRTKFDMDFQSMCLYLKTYLKKQKPEVAKILSSEIKDDDENKPNFCLLVLGMHQGLPTLVQFNSFLDFEPRYLFTKKSTPKFSTIFFGDDNPEKKKLFKETTSYMEKRAAALEDPAIGLVGEIMVRGIYKKADMEEKIGPKKKYAGGIVNVGGILNTGKVFPLSIIQSA